MDIPAIQYVPHKDSLKTPLVYGDTPTEILVPVTSSYMVQILSAIFSVLTYLVYYCWIEPKIKAKYDKESV
jgi:hypothetical protein